MSTAPSADAAAPIGALPTHRLHLLGGWQLWRPDGATVTLRRKEQALLAYLVLERGERRGRRALVDLLWPALPAEAGRNNLRVALSRLRRALATAEDPDVTWLASDDDAVWLRPAGRLEVDVWALLDGDVSRAGPALLPELDLPACPAFRAWLDLWRERVHVATAVALEQAARQALDGDRFGDAEGYAARLIELDALVEAGHEVLAAAQVRAGRVVDAERTIRRCADLLSAELGIRPGPAIGALAAHLQGRITAWEPVGAAEAPLAVLALPAPVTTFFGREAELEEIGELVRTRSARLMTLVGAGGMGKTRLALEVARSFGRYFQDGAAFVPAAGLRRAEELPSAIAHALGLHDVAAATDAAAVLLDRLRERDVLVVLDNVEHLIEGCAALVADLLSGCPYLVLLATSREELRISAEHRLRLRGLSHPGEAGRGAQASEPVELGAYDAVRMFLDRARRIVPVRLDDGTGWQIAAIARAVEGMPLGIELAAASLRSLSLEEVADSISGRAGSVVSDLRDIEPRHRSIAVVYEQSVNRLDLGARLALESLSVFRGGFTAVTAHLVAGASIAALTQLERASLVDRLPSGRFHVHELVRQLSETALRADTRRYPAVRRRHRAHFLDLLAGSSADLNTDRAPATRAQLQEELDNLRLAWSTAVTDADVDRLVAASDGLVSLAEAAGLGGDAIAMLAAAASVAVTPEAVAVLNGRLARAARVAGVLDVANAAIAAGLAAAGDASELRGTASRLHATHSELRAVWHADRALIDTSLDAARAALDGVDDDPVFAAFLDAHEGNVALERGDFARAEPLLLAARSALEASGHLRGLAVVQAHLAAAYAEEYRIWEALEADRVALDLVTRLGNATRQAVLHHNCADDELLFGRFEEAERHAVTCLGLLQRSGDTTLEAYVHTMLGEVLEGLGRFDEAEVSFAAGMDRLRRLGQENYLRTAQLTWGRFLLRRSRALEGELAARDAKAFFAGAGMPHFEATAAGLLARSLTAQGDVASATAVAARVWEDYGGGRSGAGLPFPIDTLVDCHLVFAAGGDRRAEAALTLASARFRAVVESIPDPAIRASFIHRVPACRELAEAVRREA